MVRFFFSLVDSLFVELSCFGIMKSKTTSRLKYILTDQRCTMTQDRLCHLALMAIYPERLSALTNKVVIARFHRAKNRRAIKRHSKIDIEGSNCLLLRNFCFFNFKPLFSEFSAQIKLFRFHCLSLCPAIRISVRWLFLLK